jgi:tetratricopeptide (TPR) repeat protein
MGDRGMEAGLRRILVKIARAGGNQRRFDVVASIRDASLDIDAYALAADAQQLFALWLRADADQWRRLGEIHGYAGDLHAAQAALERALQMNPRDRDAQALLEQVRSGEPIPFKEIHVARRNLRRARLAAFRATSEAA